MAIYDAPSRKAAETAEYAYFVKLLPKPLKIITKVITSHDTVKQNASQL